MTQQEINNIKDKVTGYISAGRLRDAFKLIRNTTEGAMLWEIGDKVGRIEQNYAYMLRYLSDGAADPERDKMYAEIVNETYRALDELTRKLNQPEQPTLYFNTLRVMSLHRQTIDQRLDAFRQLIASNGDKRTIESLEHDIFNYVWVTFPFSQADAETISNALSDENLPQHIKYNISAALTLGLMEYFDHRRLELLMSIYDNDAIDQAVRSVALIGMLLGLFKYNNRELPQSTLNRLAAIKDRSDWASDLKTAFLELIRTRETERITRTMEEDIIPGMIKLRPGIMDKLRDNNIDPESIEVNPEWEGILESSGMSSKLKELSELQMEGADVFMSTFAKLKSFGFFNEISHWFLPFIPERSEVVNAGIPANFGSMVKNLPFLCDSDKYSIVLSISSVPESQRAMLFSQFEHQSEAQLEEMMKAESSLPKNVRRATVSQYLQNIYRFYNLFRRKGEFFNPFDKGVNLLKVKALANDFNDAEMLRVVAEFFFKLGFWDDALDAFIHLDKISDPEAMVFQKIGYCYHKLGQLDNALEYYHQAELFEPNSAWLIGRIAAAYREKEDYDEAINYYKKLADTDPSNVDYALLLGYVLTQGRRYAEAVQQFYKVEFLDERGTRALRPLAWTLFVNGDYEASQRYYAKIMQNNPTIDDLLNMGHVALAQSKYNEAIQFYCQSLGRNGKDTESFFKAMRSDAPTLHDAGVNDRTISLVIDAVLYSLK
jgi:tetratricopeptide (TPR) repeat protein